MLLLLIPLLLFALSSAGKPKFEDDESLYANLTKTLLEISQTPVEELTLDELSAAHGKHIPPEHRNAAEDLLRYRTDRPLGALIGDLQTFGSYTPEMAEEFSRGAMRALLDKSYMLPPTRKLEMGDHLCRCNQRQCASISNELYAVLGPEMSTFCRTDKYGHCMQTVIRTTNNTNEIELFCGHSYATEEQKDLHDSDDYKHNHLCKSVKDEGRSCCKGAMCNDMPLPLMDPLDTALEAKVKELNANISMWRQIAVCLIVVVFILMAILIFVVLILCKFDLEEVKKKLAAVSAIPIAKLDETEGRIDSRYFHHDVVERGSTAGSESPLIASYQGTDTMTISTGSFSTVPTKSTVLDETTFGLFSGTGGNILANATLSSFIKILEPLGQGKFGRVFLGRWRGGEKIAVKKFHNEHRESFEQEVEILMSGMMSYSNILRWVGKDSVYNGHNIEHWIMMEYHPNGSLYDYMEKNELSEHTLLNMIRGITNGVSFLHSEIQSNPGTNGKKSVAHCDLKTKNILVKSDLTCVIADFGMAVIDSLDGQVKVHHRGPMRSGTVRYLAPEVLLDNIDQVKQPNRFIFYRHGDMYSLALIIWECARRTHATFGKEWKPAHSMEDSLAYYKNVPREPTVEDMIEVVAARGDRPEIDDSWTHNATFLGLSRIITECWVSNPETRLHALKVKLLIDKLCREANVKCPTGYD